MISLRADKKTDVTIPLLDGSRGTVYFGKDANNLDPIEILVSSSSKQPSAPEIRAIYKWRKNDRSNLVVIAIEAKGRIHLYGPAEDRQPITVEVSTAIRVLQAALDDTTVLASRKNLVSFYDNFGSTEMAGIKNKGLFATHHLRDNLPQRKDWKELQNQGQVLAKKRHRELIKALGFEISTEERNTLILKAGPEKRVIAVLLEDNENFDSPSGRFPSSPVAWGLTVAAENNVPWLIVLKKDQIRLHPGRDGVGVGQKGQAETFLELNLAQIDEQHLALLPLIFSATALEKDGDVQKILDESSKYAVVLGARLRERVYESVVPNISIAVAKKLQSQGIAMDSDGLQKAYSITLKILFRLLFQAYAEDRGLLPAGRNEGYDANSLKTIAKRDMEAKPEDFGNVVNIWHDLVQVWDSIDEGNPRWQVPAYNGGLFGRDPELHPEGALIKSLELTDTVLGPALQALLIDMTEDGVRGPVDFRSLSVREFGTIYEGLLESSLSLAEVDLTVDNKDAWVPAKEGDTVMAKAGEPYFHSASGERKATGSYFTPKFVVDHLVERAIDPTIDKHLGKIAGYLRAGDQATAGREFFDFRVADLAMGSAHFLVAAVDRIEAKMRSFLSNPENVVPGVINEIQRLRQAATVALRGDEIAINEIEDPSLLRRQIARRCIYGIDINPMAVELARLAIWIHTFVPGLPMSTLNHNLVCGNSLTGLGSIEGALDALMPKRRGQATFFDDVIYDSLELAKNLLVEAANASEADKSEVAQGSELSKRAAEAAKSVAKIFDVATAARLDLIDGTLLLTTGDLLEAGENPEIQELIRLLKPCHMPVMFPEVFLRDNPGFDVLIGNPPWEKVKVEEYRFWNLRFPGIIGMSQIDRKSKIATLKLEHPALNQEFEELQASTEYMRKLLTKSFGEDLGSGDFDLYQAFCVKNWDVLASDTGRLGIVLPRNAIVGSGMTKWREKVMIQGCFESIVTAVNTRQWVFESVHPQYAVSFLSIFKGSPGVAKFVGPVHSREEFEAKNHQLAEATLEQLKSFNPNLAIPAMDSPKTLLAMIAMRISPSFGDQAPGWDFRPVRELDAALDKEIINLEASVDSDSIEIFAGSSFQIWNNKHSRPFGYQLESKLRRYLAKKLENQVKLKRSAYFEAKFNIDNLPLDEPRIAFRTVTRSVDTRTCIPCLLPPKVAMTNGPVIFRRSGETRDEAFLLGVMSSIPFDWYCRKFVEMNFTFELLNSFPIPRQNLKTAQADRLIELVASIQARDIRYLDWVKKVNVQTIPLSGELVSIDLLAEMDALVSILFELDGESVSEIFETFHRGWDYKPRLDKVLEYYEEWKDK